MATVTTPTKTNQTDLLAWQDVASGADVIGTAFDCSGVFAAGFTIKVGRQTSTAFTAGYPNILIEVSTKSSGNDEWVPIYSFQPAVGASIATTTLNGAVAGGDTTINLTSATNVAANDLLFLGHTTTVANYELAVVKSLSSTTVTLNQACANAHDSGAKVSDQAEQVTFMLDLTGYLRVRARANDNGSGQGIFVEVTLTTLTNLSNA